MPASRFLKYTGRNWPNPVWSFYLPVSTSRDATVVWRCRAPTAVGPSTRGYVSELVPASGRIIESSGFFPVKRDFQHRTGFDLSQCTRRVPKIAALRFNSLCRVKFNCKFEDSQFTNRAFYVYMALCVPIWPVSAWDRFMNDFWFSDHHMVIQLLTKFFPIHFEKTASLVNFLGPREVCHNTIILNGPHGAS